MEDRNKIKELQYSLLLQKRDQQFCSLQILHLED